MELSSPDDSERKAEMDASGGAFHETPNTWPENR